MARLAGYTSGETIRATILGRLLPCLRCGAALPQLYIVHPGGRRLPEQLCPRCVGALWDWVLTEEAAASAGATD